MRTGRPTTVIVAVASTLVLVTIVVLVFVRGDDVATFEEGTPEKTAQDYLDAAFSGDFDRAAALIEPSSDCDADDLDRAFMEADARINLVESVTEGDRARVRVAVEVPSGGPLGGVYQEEHVLRLVRVADSWALTGVPWPLYDCTTPGT